MKSLYDKLSVSEFASTAEIKAAFAKIAAIKHPDITFDSDDLYDFNEAFKAHEILTNSKNRKQYDRLLRMGQNSQGKTYKWQQEQEKTVQTDYSDMGYKDFVKKRIYLHMFFENPMAETVAASIVATIAIICTLGSYHIIDAAQKLPPDERMLEYVPLGFVGFLGIVMWYLFIHFILIQSTNRKIANSGNRSKLIS